MTTGLVIVVVLAALAFRAQLPVLVSIPWLLGVGWLMGRSVGVLRTIRRVR